MNRVKAVSTGFDRESFHRLYGPQNRESFFYSLVDETGDFLAFFDGVIFHENLSKSVKRNFMGAIEADLRDTDTWIPEF